MANNSQRILVVDAISEGSMNPYDGQMPATETGKTAAASGNELGTGRSFSSDAATTPTGSAIPGNEAQTGVMLVSVESLRANPLQPRQHIGEEGLKALACSIAENGILQPIIVRDNLDRAGEFEIVAGDLSFVFNESIDQFCHIWSVIKLRGRHICRVDRSLSDSSDGLVLRLATKVSWGVSSLWTCPLLLMVFGNWLTKSLKRWTIDFYSWNVLISGPQRFPCVQLQQERLVFPIDLPLTIALLRNTNGPLTRRCSTPVSSHSNERTDTRHQSLCLGRTYGSPFECLQHSVKLGPAPSLLLEFFRPHFLQTIVFTLSTVVRGTPIRLYEALLFESMKNRVEHSVCPLHLAIG